MSLIWRGGIYPPILDWANVLPCMVNIVEGRKRKYVHDSCCGNRNLWQLVILMTEWNGLYEAMIDVDTPLLNFPEDMFNETPVVILNDPMPLSETLGF